MSLRMIALDMDGTTLNSDHQLSTKTIETLRRFSASGILICIATGRSISGIDKSVEILNLAQPVVPAVVNNGGFCFLFEKTGEEWVKKVLFANLIPEQSIRKLIDFSDSKGCVMQYYNGEIGEVLAVPKTDEHYELLKKYEILTAKKQTFLTSYEEAIAISQSAKALVMTYDAEMIMEEAKKVQLDKEFNMFRGSPSPFFVEFLRPDVSKGHALKQMCEYFKINVKDVTAFGDGENDAEFLKFSGYGIAMKNAKDLPKQVADLVIEWTNDEDGVALQLERMEYQGMFAKTARTVE